MYRNLSPESLGLSCRQSELIELTLTHGFGGFDLNLVDFKEEIDTKGVEIAGRLLKSARIKLNGGELPLQLAAVEGKFEAELEMAKPLFDAIKDLGVHIVQATVEPGNPQRPYHENFEFHRQRLQRLGDFLEERELRLGLNFMAPPEYRESYPQPFISKADELVMLLKLVSHSQVGLVVDLWHWAVSGSSLDQLANLTPDQITEVRLADLPVGVEAASASDNLRAFPGTSDNVSCVDALARLGQMEYPGAVTIAPHLSQMDGGNREEIIRRVVEKHDELFKSAGLNSKGRLAAAATS